MSRRFTSPLYLRIKDIPEYAKLTAGGPIPIDSLAAPLRARNATSELLNRTRFWSRLSGPRRLGICVHRQPR